MSPQETKSMIVRVIAEIQSLRDQLADAQPKAHAYKAITQILDLLPGRSQGYSEDIVYKLQRELEKMSEPKPEPEL